MSRSGQRNLVGWIWYSSVIPNLAILLRSPLRRRIERSGPRHDGCGSKENLLPIWWAQRPGTIAVPARIMRDYSLCATSDKAILSPLSLHCPSSIALARKEAAQHALCSVTWGDVIPTHFLPAWMWSSPRWHRPAPSDTAQLTDCGFSSCYKNDHNWCLCLGKGRLGTPTQSSEPSLTSSLSIYLLLEGWGRKKKCYAGWLTHNWLNSATVKRVGVYWVYLVGMRACYIRRLYKEMVIRAHNTQHAEKSILTHIWHTIGAQHTWLKSSNEARVQQKKLFWWEQSETLLPESQHKTIGHDSLLPTTMAVWSK